MAILMRLAARVSRLRKGRSKVVLVLCGGYRGPFEGERVRRTVRRAVRIADALDSRPPDVWIYGADCHRLPAIKSGSLEAWIADWAVLAKSPVFGTSKENGNPLARSAEEYGLFNGGSVAEAMKILRTEYGSSLVPVLVLFHVESMEGDDSGVAGELEKTSGKPLFWQFLAQLDGMHPSVLNCLDDVRRERPSITNTHYNNSWDMDTSVGMDTFMQYGMIKPYARWAREPRRRKLG
ncbi:VWA domain-containing protein [Streptomyces globisporus]|uniref:VWA domain-containing protein n=1 Tax=Streptomyces globisporus TaxID=1908 RepID=UPI0036F73225|nr:VWA domain-containing protein [Streptomyces globisporus]